MRRAILVCAIGATMALTACGSGNSNAGAQNTGLFTSPSPTGTPANIMPPKFTTPPADATVTCTGKKVSYPLTWKGDNTYAWSVSVDGKEVTTGKGNDPTPGLTVSLTCDKKSHEITVALTAGNAQTTTLTVTVKITAS